MGIRICGTGSFAPENLVENSRFESLVDTSDEWIRTRTGIRSRRFVRDESNLEMMLAAARRALENAGIGRGEVGAVIAATVTPDYITPPMSCCLQRDLALPEETFVCDINAACSGFLYALRTAEALLAAMPGKYALVLGSEVMSRIVDFSDRSTCVLFGDGAGAAVAGQREGAFHFFSKARGNSELLRCGALYGAKNPFGGDRAPPEDGGMLQMNGREVFRFAVESIVSGITRVREMAGAPDLDVIVCHQANERIIEAAAKRLGFPRERFFMNVASRGNTSAASIPIALDELNRQGGLKRGDTVALAGFGGGLTCGAACFEW